MISVKKGDVEVLIEVGDVIGDLQSHFGRLSSDFMEELHHRMTAGDRAKVQRAEFTEQVKAMRLKNFRRRYGPRITEDDLPKGK